MQTTSNKKRKGSAHIDTGYYLHCNLGQEINYTIFLSQDKTGL